jgi:hypothetical protein
MELDNSWVSLRLTRGPIRGKDRNLIGLILRIQARREVEEFMSGLAGGRRSPLDVVGDGWHTISLDGAPLEFYDAEFRSPQNQSYTLNGIGLPVLLQNRDRDDVQRPPREIARQLDEQVNLSFLRLVGISEDSGVSVGLAGAYSEEYFRKLKAVFMPAATQFLRDYLVPITINLHVVSK